jgi:SacI homology domain
VNKCNSLYQTSSSFKLSYGTYLINFCDSCCAIDCFFTFICKNDDTSLTYLDNNNNKTHSDGVIIHTLNKLLTQPTVSINHDSSPSWKTCDERFFWNLNVLSDLIDTPGIDERWITPVTNMWVSSEDITLKMKKSPGNHEEVEEKFLLTLISRRNRRRQGPRCVLKSLLLIIFSVFLFFSILL